MLEGKPFRVNFTHDGTAGYANRTAFNLNTVNWDYNADGILETTPFLNQMFVITGLKIAVGSGTTLGGVIVDGKAITFHDFVGPGVLNLFLDGRSINSISGNYPRLRDLYDGVHNESAGVVMRDKIEIWNSAGSSSVVVYMTGIRLRREY